MTDVVIFTDQLDIHWGVFDPDTQSLRIGDTYYASKEALIQSFSGWVVVYHPDTKVIKTLRSAGFPVNFSGGFRKVLSISANQTLFKQIMYQVALTRQETGMDSITVSQYLKELVKEGSR